LIRFVDSRNFGRKQNWYKCWMVEMSKTAEYKSRNLSRPHPHSYILTFTIIFVFDIFTFDQSWDNLFIGEHLKRLEHTNQVTPLKIKSQYNRKLSLNEDHFCNVYLCLCIYETRDLERIAVNGIKSQNITLRIHRCLFEKY
jgi:hypothetical protein